MKKKQNLRSVKGWNLVRPKVRYDENGDVDLTHEVRIQILMWLPHQPNEIRTKFIPHIRQSLMNRLINLLKEEGLVKGGQERLPDGGFRRRHFSITEDGKAYLESFEHLRKVA